VAPEGARLEPGEYSGVGGHSARFSRNRARLRGWSSERSSSTGSRSGTASPAPARPSCSCTASPARGAGGRTSGLRSHVVALFTCWICRLCGRTRSPRGSAAGSTPPGSKPSTSWATRSEGSSPRRSRPRGRSSFGGSCSSLRPGSRASSRTRAAACGSSRRSTSCETDCRRSLATRCAPRRSRSCAARCSPHTETCGPSSPGFTPRR
jgi:hypothetical protein